MSGDREIRISRAGGAPFFPSPHPQSSPHPLSLPRLAALALVVALMLVPAAAPGQPVPCPEVEVPAEVSRLVAFRPGPSRGPGDMTFEVSFIKTGARCTRSGGRLVVGLRLEMMVRLGPASQSRKADLAYFVALTDGAGQIREKWIFSAEARLEDSTQLRLWEELELVIPEPPADAPPGHRLYVGFQLSEEQVRYNRSGGVSAPPSIGTPP